MPTTKQRAAFALFTGERKEAEETKRRRVRAACRSAKKAAREALKRQKEALVVVATYNLRTLALKGKNGCGHDERVLAKGRRSWL